MPQLKGKVALVTGAAGGFGEGIARLFVAEGARVMIADLDSARALKVADELGPSARAVGCDVSRAADVNAAVAACVAAFGPPTLSSTTRAPRTATSRCWRWTKPHSTGCSTSTSSRSTTWREPLCP